MEKHDVVVIGGGPAGMAAAISAYDNGIRDVLILDREEETGGILRQCIHPGFGIHRLGKELTGPEYAKYDRERVRERGISVYSEATVLSLTADRILTVSSPKGYFKIQAGAVVLAMGCRERSRGALSIPGTRPAGIYSAGTAQRLMNCDGYLVGKRAVILGSGDIGLIMARRMVMQGATVAAVCEVMPYPGGLQRNLVQCLEDFGIPLYLKTTVTKIHGEKRLEAVTVSQVDAKRQAVIGTERLIPCDTLLLSCGLIPENELTRSAGIKLDGVTGGAVVNERRETSVSGIFACGNVLHVHDLVDYVSREGEIAGKSAAEYVLGISDKEIDLSISAGKGIRYVLPQRISSADEVTLYFRVSAPCRNSRIVVRSGNQILKERKCIKLFPGEMESIPLTEREVSLSRGEIEVSLEDVI